MDILISANESVLQFMRSIPRKTEEDMDREKLMKWFEETDKGNDHNEYIQEVTV